MLALAALATINQVAQLARPTPRDQPQHFTMMGRHPGLILGNVVRSKLPQCIGDGIGRLGSSREHLARVLLLQVISGCEQLVDHLPGIGFGDLGQVQVDQGGLQTRMPQVFLDRLEADSRFEQMGGVRMAQRVARNRLVKF